MLRFLTAVGSTVDPHRLVAMRRWMEAPRWRPEPGKPEKVGGVCIGRFNSRRNPMRSIWATFRGTNKCCIYYTLIHGWFWWKSGIMPLRIKKPAHNWVVYNPPIGISYLSNKWPGYLVFMFHYSYIWEAGNQRLPRLIWYLAIYAQENGLTFHEVLVLLKWSVCCFVRQNWRKYLKPPSITTLHPKGQLPVIHPPPVVFFWCKHQPWICDSSMFGTPLRWWWEMLVYHGRSHKKAPLCKSKPTNPTNTYPWLKSHFKQTKATFTLPYQASNFEICSLISSQN